MSSSSSLELTSSSTIKTVTRSHKRKPKPQTPQKHTVSLTRSITEDLFDEEKILTSLILNNEATENYTSRYLSGSFVSDSESTSTSFDSESLSKSRTSESSFVTKQYSSFQTKSTKNPYTNDFESLTNEEETSSYDSDLEEFLSLSATEKSDLRKSDHVKYLLLKIKADQNEMRSKKKAEKQPLKYYATNKKQIEKLVQRVMDHSEQSTDDEKKTPLNDVKYSNLVKPEVINRLDAVNTVTRIKREQAKKIEDFGSELDLKTKISVEEYAARNQKLYFKMKSKQIQSKLTNEHFGEHEAFYCDSIMLIGHLAGNLPKLSDPHADVWTAFMKPLEQSENLM